MRYKGGRGALREAWMKRLSFVIGAIAALAVGVADASAQGRGRGNGGGNGRGWERREQMQPGPPQRYGPPPRYDGRGAGSGRYREVERYQQQRSWGRGDRLPPGYGAAVPNPGAYRLRQPPPGYNWVQNGRDLYLMQQGTGLVLDAIPGGGF
jgi:Ni/Co efflux regulator RcnB